MARPETILVTGAIGYIGGRLVPRLIQEGRRVRVLVCSRTRALSRSWSDQVEVAVGDALSPQALSKALAGVDSAYYLIHSMSKESNFHELDVQAARTFGQEARKAGVNRIIYLGGLGDPEADLSRHLRSRQETGQALREGGVPVTEFRAAVVIGSGSTTYLRHPDQGRQCHRGNGRSANWGYFRHLSGRVHSASLYGLEAWSALR